MESSADRLFDRYLDALLEGQTLSPEEFCLRDSIDEEHLDDACRRLHALLSGEATPVDSADPLPSDEDLKWAKLGDYRLLREIGSGGMGVVFLAEQESLSRLVALKVLRPELTNSPTARTRLEREAKAIASLKSEGIVGIHDFGFDQGVHFLAMDFVRGKSLDEVISEEREQSRLSPQQVMDIGVQLGRALADAHRAQVIHRDLKPSNVILSDAGRVKVVDFGLAKNLGDENLDLTQSFAGTPRYASPEQISGRKDRIGPATDIYGIGTILYEAVCGAPPFAATSIESLIRAVTLEGPVPPRQVNKKIPKDLEVVIMKALEKDPDQRYGTADELADDLEAILNFAPIKATPPSVWGRLSRWRRRHRSRAAALLTALVAGLAFVVFLIAQHFSMQHDDESHFESLLDRAQDKVARYSAERTVLEQDRWQLWGLNNSMAMGRLTNQERRQFEELDQRVKELTRKRSVALEESFGILRQAEDLRPDDPRLSEAMAAYYYERWLDSRKGTDSPLSAHYRDEALRYGKSDQWQRRLANYSPAKISSTPQGARVHLFRYYHQDDLAVVWPKAPWLSQAKERRLVPSPCQSEAPVLEPGILAYRVGQDSGDFRRADLVVKVDGEYLSRKTMNGPWRIIGNEERKNRDSENASSKLAVGAASLTVLRNNKLLTIQSTNELRLERTRVPLFKNDANYLGTTPLPEMELKAGWYLAVFDLDGQETRVSFHVDYLEDPFHNHGHADINLNLAAAMNGPDGFVYIPAAAHAKSTEASYWMMKREVSQQEWQNFLNNEPHAEIKGRPRPIGNMSCAEAQQYAAWYTKNFSAGRWEFSLPNKLEWHRVSFGGDSRRYPFGNYFRSHWVGSRFASRRPKPSPSMSFSRDESPYGIFDMAGNLAEWNLGDAAHGSQPSKAIPQGRVHSVGGSYLHSLAADFSNNAMRNHPLGHRSPAIGFRLVAHPVSEAK